MKGRSKSLLLAEQVIDFQCLLGSPWPTGKLIDHALLSYRTIKLLRFNFYPVFFRNLSFKF